MSVTPLFNGEKVYKNLNEIKSDRFDAIIIGSGMAGMSCAAALAKEGLKVCVLERHYLPGGYTHMFTRKGYEWDVGIHAVGEMKNTKKVGRMLGWLSNNQVEMISLGKVYDEFRFPDNFTIGFPDNKNDFLEILKTKFPNEKEIIDQYYVHCKNVAKSTPLYLGLKFLPEKLGTLSKTILHKFKKDYWGITTTQLLNELGASPKLQSVLTSQWGYYGSTPDESSFAMHALVMWHFKDGAYFPKGGSKSIAAALLKNVIDHGGEVLIRAKVKEILIENNQAVGVLMEDGKKIFAKYIISATAAKVTVNQLLPQKYQTEKWVADINKLDNSPPYICLNMGFKGVDLKDLGFTKSNIWLNETWDMNHKYWKINDKNAQAPILYLSFPSLKDPLYNPGAEIRHTGECVTFVDYDVFKKWENSSFGKRTEDYNEFKKEIADRLIRYLKEKLPELMKYLDYYELSTPLTANHYVNAVHGAIYGLEHTPRRFNTLGLRTKTPIKNFYLSGVDTLTCGVAGALNSGLLTAATIKPKLFKHFI